MLSRPGLRWFFAGVFAFVFACQIARAQAPSAQAVETGRQTRALIPQNIDEGKRVALAGNTRHEARMENDRGAVAEDFPMEHMLLQLQRPPEVEKELQQFIEELHNPKSPNFHHWLTAQEFGERFGVAKQDLNAIKGWLESHGFRVNVIYPSGVVIDFSGTAGQVREAFRTEIHHLEVKGEKHIANMSDPQIPAALAPVVAGIVSLHDFRPHTMHKMRKTQAEYTFTGAFGGDTFAVVPADLATIYNLNPLFSAGYSGQGQTIVLIEDTNVFTAADWNTFRSTFGLSSYTGASFTTVYPAPTSGANNCNNPGVISPNDAEAILDAEWASASAPSAAIQMASCADTSTTFGGLIAIQNLINASSAPPAIMSISYGQCETVNGATANAAYNAAYQQAVAEGVSVFVAAGDSGAAGCDNSVSAATHGIGMNAFASTPYDVAVGGTDFSDTYAGTNATYWSSTNSAAYGSALSYIPEIPWNDSCASVLIANYEGYPTTYGVAGFCNSLFGGFFATTVAGGGGPSGCATGSPSVNGVVSGTCQGWAKPSWQAVVGNPNDGVRDAPDVSLFAADGLWSHYYVFCWSNTAQGGAACTGAPSGWSGAGGTSFAAPILAGIQALVNQKTGSRQGNPNPTYYRLAASEYGSGGNTTCNSTRGNGVASSCIFYDVTQGDMDVNCTGTANCYLAGGAEGVLSTSNTAYQPAYGTSTGWDFATGLGTINAANLVNNWTAPTPDYTLSASPNGLSVAQGSSGTSTITVTPQNGFSGSVSLSASGLPSGVTASFSPNPATTTSTLTLTASSTATTGTATVTIIGTSGNLTSTSSIALTVTPPPNFALSAAPSSLSIAQGTGAASTVSVTPQNGFSSSVSLSASGLPSGVTAAFSPNPATTASTLTLTAGSTATTGTVAVTITGTSGSLAQTTTIALTVRIATNFPPGWLEADVGSVGTAGGASYANGTFTVSASGQWIWSTADGMHFVYQPLSGDGTIVARVVSAQGSTYPQAGVMIRETLNANSAHAYVAYEPYPGPSIYFYSRASAGASTSAQGTAVNALPYWVKLVRSGSTFRGYTSSDGVNWVQVGSNQSINMAQNVYIGLAVSANNNSALATATFDNVSANSNYTLSASPSSVSITLGGSAASTITVTPQNGFSGSVSLSASGLPSGVTASFSPNPATTTSTLTLTASGTATTGTVPVTITGTSGGFSNTTVISLSVIAAASSTLPLNWSDGDVGSVGTAGSASHAMGTFTVKASGKWIYDVADGMHFVYQPLSGDGTIVARVVSVQGSTYPEAGVMIRETLSAGSTHGYAAYEPYPGPSIYFYTRASTGASTGSQSRAVNALPYWVKLVRSGSTFSGYMSSDGMNWVQVGSSQSINMAQNVYVGLAVSANNNSVVATATFDNVSVNSASAPAPVITTVSATTGSIGSQVQIFGSGFGASQGSSVVMLNGAPVTINSWSDASITITIPSGATSGSLLVSVAPSMNDSNPVVFTVTSQPLPPPWLDRDVGSVGTAGSASYAMGTFTVKASGKWIYDVADGMHFVYQPLSGDGTIVARVVSVQGSTYPEAGVMIRETLSANSTHAYVAYEPYPGPSIYYYSRASTGSSTGSQSTAVNALPYWVKLVRSGSTFTGYRSSDGVNWVQVGSSLTINMAQSVYLGLAVSANNNANSSPAVVTAAFDNVTVN